MPRLFIAFISSILFAGCASTSLAPTLVTRVKSTYVPIPAELMNECPVETPPDATVYPTLSNQEKEEALIVYSQKLLLNLGHCNNQLSHLRAWDTKTQQIYTPINEAKK